MSAAGARRDTRVRTRSSKIPTFAAFERACDHVATCDGCGDPVTWRGMVEGVTCDLCSACRKAGVVP